MSVQEQSHLEPLFSGITLLESFQKAFAEGKADVAPTIEHLRVFMFIALATTLDEKIELRSLSGPKSPFGAGMSQTKMHRICVTFKKLDLLDTEKGDYDPRLHTIHLTTKGHAFAKKLSALLQDVPDVTLPWKAKVDELLSEANDTRIWHEDLQHHLETINAAVASVEDWRAELKKVLGQKGIVNAEVGKNYVKTNRTDGSTRGSVSMNVLLKRTESRDIVDLTAHISTMAEDELDELLTPNIKHRKYSDDAQGELNAMLNKYSSAAIAENPELQRRFALLAAQVAREANSQKT